MKKLITWFKNLFSPKNKEQPFYKKQAALYRRNANLIFARSAPMSAEEAAAYDAAAIASDWQAVGQDLWTAIEEEKKNKQ